MTDIKSGTPSAILVLPFADGIGDFVNMQPLLAGIARRFPKAIIKVAASPYANFLTAPNHSTIKIVTPSWFEKEPGPIAQTLRHFVPQSVLARMAGPILKRELGGQIDLVVNTILLWEQRMDFHNYWTPQIPARPGAVHTLDCLADALQDELDLVISPDERYPRLEVRPNARQWAQNYLTQNNIQAENLIALIPESNMEIKKWPAANWAAVSDELTKRGYQPLFFAPADSKLISRISRLAKLPVHTVNTTLDNVAGLLEITQLAIGVDTGLLHIASAVGTRWLGLFGPTNPDVTGPYNRKLGQGLVAPFPRGKGCLNCWKSFKYEDDECQTLEQGACIDSLDRRVVLETALKALPATLVYTAND